ncbi:unnamed protein product [Cyprideis torosa]|uniref:Diphosphomevalonate decarboxylase n=1 Tax=Cyprideis torosa TaxID=163714 RepID=A0A7R8WDZ6_9CRUS|nr:unnamed protein product [Cyprideis torosa]CAG0889094.1 unnamed protein product [Cyprideis torosa]
MAVGNATVEYIDGKLCTRTLVEASPEWTEDSMTLNGQAIDLESPSKASDRVRECLRSLRNLLVSASYKKSDISPSWGLRIVSENNFPTAAGLASSAAGYAALADGSDAPWKKASPFTPPSSVFAVGQLYGLPMASLSPITRKGSGSACRSLFGGVVHWARGSDEEAGLDSVARPITGVSAEFLKQLRILICVDTIGATTESIVDVCCLKASEDDVQQSESAICGHINDRSKSVGSTEGMQRSMATSSLLRHRTQALVDEVRDRMVQALRSGDLPLLLRLSMVDSNQMHACLLDSYPPIAYLTDTSFAIIRLVHEYNGRQDPVVGYTFDAGPNAVLITTGDHLALLVRRLSLTFPPLGSEDSLPIRGLPVPELGQDAEQGAFIPPETRPGGIQFLVHTQVDFEGPEITRLQRG